MQFPSIAPVQFTADDPASSGRIAAPRENSGELEATFEMFRLMPDGESDEALPTPQEIALNPNSADGTKVGRAANRAVEAILGATQEVFAVGNRAPAVPDVVALAETAAPSPYSDKTMGVVDRAETAGLRASANAGNPPETIRKEDGAEAQIDPREGPVSHPPQAPQLIVQPQPRTKDVSVDHVEVAPGLPSVHAVAAGQPNAPVALPHAGVSSATSVVTGVQSEGAMKSVSLPDDRSSAPLRMDQTGPQRAELPRSRNAAQANEFSATQPQLNGASQASPQMDSPGYAAPAPGFGPQRNVAGPKDSMSQSAAMANVARQSARSVDRLPSETEPTPAGTRDKRRAGMPDAPQASARPVRENPAPTPGDLELAPTPSPLKSREAVAPGPVQHLSQTPAAAEKLNMRPTRPLSPDAAFSQPTMPPPDDPALPKGIDQPPTPPGADRNSAVHRTAPASASSFPNEAAGRQMPDRENAPVVNAGREGIKQRSPDRLETSDRPAPVASDRAERAQVVPTPPLAPAPPSANNRPPDAPVLPVAKADLEGGNVTRTLGEMTTPRTAPAGTRRAPEPAPTVQPPAAPAPNLELAAQPDTREPAAGDIDAPLSEVRGIDARTSTTAAPGAASPHASRHDPAHITLQIADSIRANGEKATELHLQPEELGRVRFSVNHDGAGLSVSLSIDRPDTLDLIRRHVDLLADDLRRLGYSSVNFSFNGEGAHQRQAQASAPPETTASAAQTEEGRPAPEPLNQSGRIRPARPGASGMDIRV